MAKKKEAVEEVKKEKKDTKVKNVHDVAVKIEGDTWKKAVDHVFEEKRKTVKVDGFRKGKYLKKNLEKNHYI